MGKRRKLSQKGQAHKSKGSISGRNQKPSKLDKPKSGGGGGSSSNSTAPGAGKPPTKKQQPQQRPVEPTIPFAPEDKILLIGDGDLSFAASLIEHHYCADVTATVLEKSLDELRDKYPHVEENIAKIEAEDGKVLYGVDATKMAPFTDRKGRDGTGVMDRILFNFPHVGGKSTDVNRQVRYNQELLVAFFQRAMPSLAPGGSIVVTLFEGEPYTLWNIRDLGRHAGLQVERSFQFQAAAYPGYHHARTLGVVRSKDGEIGGGWKGEDRPARSYVFVRKDEAPKPAAQKKGKKRARKDDSDSSDDE
jgi:25S rRNA (uracil2634-N3)-methyltransferase